MSDVPLTVPGVSDGACGGWRSGVGGMSSWVPSDAAITTLIMIVTTTAAATDTVFETTATSYNMMPYKQVFCGSSHVSGTPEVVMKDYLITSLNDPARICQFM